MVCGRVLVGLCVLVSSGCSAYMAAVGSYPKDVSVLRVGMLRADVEFHLGVPKEVSSHSDGTTTHIFEFERGNEPSLGRATGHAVLTTATFGLWEFIAIPIELTAGETVRLSITYNQDDRVIAFQTLK
ncbi:MAG: hypothetical protein GDA50_07065 [Alphaproteobacteria bacterium GM202ARS2]|nr:hypothetical protein [Alphaproteobacteria bacterium GM202ARS2]